MGCKNRFRLQQAGHVIPTTLDDELVLFDPRTERVHILNLTAAAIWQLCDGSHGGTEIAREVARAFNVSVRLALTDVSEVAEQFHEAGLVEYVPADAPTRSQLARPAENDC